MSVSDISELARCRWTKSKLGYAVTNIQGESIFMHRFLMGLMRGNPFLVDHINGDGLDNRGKNLRVCTKTQNQQNQRPRHTRKSKYKGVGYYIRDKKWRSRIVVEKRDIELGKFHCEMCAAIAYDGAARKYHGEFAWLNRAHFSEINDELHPLREVDF